MLVISRPGLSQVLHHKHLCGCGDGGDGAFSHKLVSLRRFKIWTSLHITLLVQELS